VNPHALAGTSPLNCERLNSATRGDDRNRAARWANPLPHLTAAADRCQVQRARTGTDVFGEDLP
jgi:hypothetical protein